MSDWGRHEYGKVFDAWPRTESGEPVEPAFLTHCGPLDMEAQMVQSMLEAYGIPCLVRYPHSGEFGKLVMGMSGFGTELYVPETLLDDAVALIQSDVQLEENPEGEESNEL